MESQSIKKNPNEYAGRIIEYRDENGEVQYDMITAHRSEIYGPWLYGAINLSNDPDTGFYFGDRGVAGFYESPEDLLLSYEVQYGKIHVIKKDEYILSLRQNTPQNA